MEVLCDTCSILMLVRITPQMFLNQDYQCYTIPEVHKEIYQTQKFKNKYPWRNDYKKNIKHLVFPADKKLLINEYLSTINLLLENHTINENNGELFDLSYIDRVVIATALACGYKICSTDYPLLDFAEQQFPDDFQGEVLPLGLLNIWIGKKLISWDKELENVLSEWKTQDEPSQTAKDKSTYRRLTGKKYPGS